MRDSQDARAGHGFEAVGSGLKFVDLEAELFSDFDGFPGTDGAVVDAEIEEVVAGFVEADDRAGTHCEKFAESDFLFGHDNDDRDGHVHHMGDATGAFGLFVGGFGREVLPRWSGCWGSRRGG